MKKKALFQAMADTTKETQEERPFRVCYQTFQTNLQVDKLLTCGMANFLLHSSETFRKMQNGKICEQRGPSQQLAFPQAQL